MYIELLLIGVQVTGVSPREGPCEGGTRLTVRGSCLGRSMEDVVGLYVCGSNVLSSLEFISSSKLVCTTKAHKPGTGTVVVETQSGGRGVSLVQFTFTDAPPAAASPRPSGLAGLASPGLSLSAAEMKPGAGPVSYTHLTLPTILRV